ncbi:MAG: hypothetical protein ACT4TC_14795 [Myxococcaceae bacterium]
MLVLSLDSLHDPVTAVCGSASAFGRFELSDKVVACDLSAPEQLAEVLFDAVDAFGCSLQDIDAFVLATGPTNDPRSLDWARRFRSLIARWKKPLHEVDELKVLSRLALSDSPEGAEVFSLLDEGDVHASAGFRLGVNRGIECILPVALRSADELEAQVSRLPAPRAPLGADSLWAGTLPRFGAGRGFAGRLGTHGTLFKPLPWPRDAAFLEPSAVAVLCHFVSEQL